MAARKKINILDESIAKKIAAGEIVENPASVVKELIENAIDADAKNISIEIKDGGREYISISDNGTGIAADDTKLAFIRHATSKISSLDDLYNIHQMGFRGEALYSISAVSKVTLISKAVDEAVGSLTSVEGGEIIKNHEYGCPDGTTVIVEDLFFNTPARKKFMKSTSVETSNISNVIQRYMLSYPEVSFKFINNDKVIYFTNGDSSLKNALFTIYGKNAAENIVEFSTIESSGISFSGCLGNKNLLGKSRNNQTVFINRRYVKDKNITAALEEMYSSNLMKNTYPFFIINVNINPLLVDVNVHPQKLNVVFSNLRQLLDELNMQLKPYFDLINGQVISFETEKIKTTSKNADVFDAANGIPDFKDASKSLTEKINKEIIEEHIVDINIPEEENESFANFAYKLNDFNYKSALVLGEDKAPSNELRQSSTAVSADYSQADFKRLSRSYTVIGTAFNGYLFVESDETVYIFDQHAAHERLIYEKYMETFKNKSAVTQNLLIPQTIDLPYDDILIVNENIDSFIKAGYILEVNDLSVDITGVPIFLGQPQLTGFFKEILANIRDTASHEGDAEEKIISMSCKKAVKAGDRLSDKEIKQLIDMVIDEEIKLTCPHGRPFVSTITKKQIEKRFGRIV
ncbi:MAG: DNA mismatch repair endonuclease MutL [Clostridia bacterium]|nr:DNA mismatch repair endonuclease MutL [Clostridia bacterium]